MIDKEELGKLLIDMMFECSLSPGEDTKHLFDTRGEYFKGYYYGYSNGVIQTCNKLLKYLENQK